MTRKMLVRRVREAIREADPSATVVLYGSEAFVLAIKEIVSKPLETLSKAIKSHAHFLRLSCQGILCFLL